MYHSDLVLAVNFSALFVIPSDCLLISNRLGIPRSYSSVRSGRRHPVGILCKIYSTLAAKNRYNYFQQKPPCKQVPLSQKTEIKLIFPIMPRREKLVFFWFSNYNQAEQNDIHNNKSDPLVCIGIKAQLPGAIPFASPYIFLKLFRKSRHSFPSFPYSGFPYALWQSLLVRRRGDLAYFSVACLHYILR